MAYADKKRQINSWVDEEIYDRVARAARKVGMSKSAYGAAFLTADIDVIDPEGATQEQE